MKQTLRRIAGWITVVFGFAFACFAGLATVRQHNTDEVWHAIDCLLIAFMSFMWLLATEDKRADQQRSTGEQQSQHP